MLHCTVPCTYKASEISALNYISHSMQSLMWHIHERAAYVPGHEISFHARQHYFPYIAWILFVLNRVE